MKRMILTAIVVASFSVSTQAEEIKILAWNLESDRHTPEFRDTNDPVVIANWLESFDGYDIFALSEVAEENAIRYVRAIARGEGAFFFYKVGDHAANDHLMLAWNSFKFESLEVLDLDGDRPGEPNLKLGARGRAPLAIRLREKPDGPEFWVMVNHFHRTSAQKRRKQSKGVRDWIITQDIPVFAVGDYNFDWDIDRDDDDERKSNKAFKIMFEVPGVTWVKPAPDNLIRTEDSHNSILDFVLSNDPGLSWSPSSEIIQRDDEFLPANKKSDHRPVTAVFKTPYRGPSPTPVGPRPNFFSERTPADFFSESASEDARRRALKGSGILNDSKESGTPAAVTSKREQMILKQIELMRGQLDLLEELVKEDK